jgi:hypothetical protein
MFLLHTSEYLLVVPLAQGGDTECHLTGLQQKGRTLARQI